jgi:uncharacterized protein YndB with AHSA1/START domain
LDSELPGDDLAGRNESFEKVVASLNNLPEGTTMAKKSTTRIAAKRAKRQTKITTKRGKAQTRVPAKRGTGQTLITAGPGKQELLITREFDAPRERVFEAFTDPKLLIQWLGPRRLIMTTLDTLTPNTGGLWRYLFTGEDGKAYAFHGVFHEVTRPERAIRTFEFEGLPEKGHVSLETARFEALPGDRTKLAIQFVFQSVADRDGMLQAGMEEIMIESHEQLDELLEEMKT